MEEVSAAGKADQAGRPDCKVPSPHGFQARHSLHATLFCTLTLLPPPGQH